MTSNHKPTESRHSHLQPHVLLHLCWVSEGIVVGVEVELGAGGRAMVPGIVHLQQGAVGLRRDVILLTSLFCK